MTTLSFVFSIFLVEAIKINSKDVSDLASFVLAAVNRGLTWTIELKKIERGHLIPSETNSVSRDSHFEIIANTWIAANPPKPDTSTEIVEVDDTFEDI